MTAEHKHGDPRLRPRRVLTEIPEPLPCYLTTDQSEGGPQSGILRPSPNPVSKTLSWEPSGGSGLLSLSLPFSSVDVFQVNPDFAANTAVRVWLLAHEALEPSLGNKSSASECHSSAVIWVELVQFSSVAQSCPTLCNPMDCSTPGLPVHHQLPEFTQTHVH